VTLPGLVPDFVQGLKLGSSYALVLMVVTEMMMTRQGLGVMLWAAWDNFRIVELYSILYLICFLGVGIFVMMETLGEWAMEFQRAV
jgi:ABC-type nitrate/sulfonate/bicarbonate transport system permease component